MLRSQILDDVSSVRSDRWSADQDREYRAVKEGKFNRSNKLQKHVCEEIVL